MGMTTAAQVRACLLAIGLACMPSFAGEEAPGPGRWFVRLGAVAVFYDSSATIVANGAPLPGASVTVSNNETITFDVGYDLTRHVAVTLLAGAPPKPTITGDGNITSLGELGEVRFGPVVLSSYYRFRSPTRALRPYAGLGVGYVIVFKEYDAAVRDLEVHGNWAVGAQAGAEYRVSPKCDVFLDFKHLWLELDADGILPGEVPFTARVTLDPLLVSVGVKFRFG